MITTEQAFDMLPTLVTLYDKLDLDDYRKKLSEENNITELDAKFLGIDFFKYIFKNSKKIKEEAFEMVAIFENKPIEEVKKQNFGKTLNTLREIFTDKDAAELFKSAIQ